ncbi:MAG: hypothetical protein ACK5WZ_11385, partial [Pseudobdellovibrionaceae bacterium]
RNPSSSQRLWNREDPQMKAGDLTIWKLREMAQNKQFDALHNLFNNGYSMDHLPVGYSAGVGARVLDLNAALGGRAIDGLTGSNWKGKYFFSTSPVLSHGLNRIREVLFATSSPIVLMGRFTTQLLDSHPLVPEAKSNMVILNYASPKTKPYLLETLLTQIQVYDVMVAVPGKFGPVYIGKTWLGSYSKDGNFTAFNSNQLIAWFFLDFNVDALQEQRLNHWDDSKEILVTGQQQ